MMVIKLQACQMLEKTLIRSMIHASVHMNEANLQQCHQYDDILLAEASYNPVSH